MPPEPGEIFHLQLGADLKVRVLAADAHEVLYDSFLEDSQEWIFARNLNQKCFFYRMPYRVFIEKSVKTAFQELSEEERSVLRPDLPLRTARIKNLSWSSPVFQSGQEMDKYFDESPKVGSLQGIASKSIWLFPQGPKGGFRAAKQIESRSEEGFGLRELFQHAGRIQTAVYAGLGPGTGLYRLGIYKRLPAYYIGGYIDLAGIMDDRSGHKSG